MNHKGFTLLEMLLYVAILSIVAVLFVGILSTGTRVQLQETAANEVSNQLNFAIQTIQRLVRDSSAIVVTNANPCTGSDDIDTKPGIPQTCLKLKMSADPQTGRRDSIFIWTDPVSGIVKMQQGVNPASDLTTNKVVVASNGLSFTKLMNYPGHNAVQINLTLNGKTTDAQNTTSLKPIIAVNRAAAATFDSTLIPGGTAGNLDIGLGSQFWHNLYLGNNSGINFKIEDGKVYEPNNYDQANNGRGMMMVGAPVNSLCGDNFGVTGICTYHTGSCYAAVALQADANGNLGGGYVACTQILSGGGFCLCD